MFHKIAKIYRYLKHLDILQASIQNLNSPEFYSPPKPYKPPEHNITGNLQEVTPDLQWIQTLPYQVQNCDEKGFIWNGNYRNIVCTYMFSPGDRVWGTQNDERAQLWYKALIFDLIWWKVFHPPSAGVPEHPIHSKSQLQHTQW